MALWNFDTFFFNFITTLARELIHGMWTEYVTFNSLSSLSLLLSHLGYSPFFSLKLKQFQPASVPILVIPHSSTWTLQGVVCCLVNKMKQWDCLYFQSYKLSWIKKNILRPWWQDVLKDSPQGEGRWVLVTWLLTALGTSQEVLLLSLVTNQPLFRHV